MNTTAEEYYKGRLSALNVEMCRVKRTSSRLYFVRLIAFLLFAAALMLSFSGENRLLYIVLTLAFLSLFVAVAIYDNRLATKRRELENRIKFNEDELRSLAHEFTFREGGASFAELNPHLSSDFDIFGAGSLYQYLNRSTTLRGKSRFAASLVACELDRETIKRRAKAIEELSTKVEFIERFATIGADVVESGAEIDNLLKWLDAESPKERFINAVRFALPAVTLLLLVLSICGYVPYSMLTIAFCVSLTAVYANTKKLNNAHALLSRITKILDKYSELIEIIEREEFSSELLITEKQKLTTGTHGASESIRALRGVLNRFDYRCNVYVSLVLNGFLLFDYHTFIALLGWKRDHCSQVALWFDAVTQIDSLTGFGIYAYNSTGQTVGASVVDGEFCIAAHNMGHPLIAPQVRVNNSIEIKGRPSIVIITGANMAGKSTFLRTLAINLILGANGAPVVAESFTFSPIKILSSIKIQDSLMNRESYFYAELLRLSEILEQTKEQGQSMIILDEILRGTNTRDKQQGSIGLLRKIIENKGVAIIATHDLIIGKMEDEFPDSVSNYCFEVEIDGEQLSFDYKLKTGISSKLNASLLMRRMGIID